MKVSTSSVLAPLVFAASAYAQLFTTTFPWAAGDTAVVSTGTDANGDPTTATIRVLTPTTNLGGGLATATTSSSSAAATALNPLDPLGTATTSSTSTTSTTTRNTRLTRTTTQTGPPTTTGPRVGDDTALPPPMRTTTYWYDVGDGSPWSVATWTATFTAAPTVATALVPQGTVQTFANYQTSVNARVLASAVASADGSQGAAAPNIRSPGVGGVVAWGVVGLGAVLGAGMVL